jgi:hypothetical protein
MTKKEAAAIKVLSDGDVTNYLDTLAELGDPEQTAVVNMLPADGTMDYVVQFFADDKYIATHLRISGPVVRSPRGVDASWQKWVHVDGEWNARVCDTKMDANRALKALNVRPRGVAYSRQGERRFEAISSFVLDLSAIE